MLYKEAISKPDQMVTVECIWHSTVSLYGGVMTLKPLKLTGDDATNLIKSLFFPTKEEITSRQKITNNINQHINIIETEKGFDAEIDNFDLDFLEKGDTKC